MIMVEEGRVVVRVGGGLWVPDDFLVVQVDLGGLGQLLGARPVAHLLVQELLGCFQLRLQQTHHQPTDNDCLTVRTSSAWNLLRDLLFLTYLYNLKVGFIYGLYIVCIVGFIEVYIHEEAENFNNP